MTSNPDLVIRGGNVADGLGGELYEADVAIADGRIVAVGRVSGKGREEIDARGKLVAPGFVDLHTHYDGQVTWSQDITPSSQNGVTSAIMGNCGVGFAPCRPADHQRLIQLMEGVEDIPEPVLSAGLPWAWESFPDYMDWLSQRAFDMDIGAQLPHAALRVYVMGERGARRDPATAEDNSAMAVLAGEAVRAGALGFSTSRTLNHRTSTGDFTPTLKAGEDELTAIAGAVPDLVFRRTGGQGAAALAADPRQHQRGFRPRPVDHRADRRAPGRAASGTGTVAQPVPDPSELQGDREAAAGRAFAAPAPTRNPRGHPRRDGDRDRRSAVLPPELRQDVPARRPARLRAAAGKRAGSASAPPRTATGRTGL